MTAPSATGALQVSSTPSRRADRELTITSKKTATIGTTARPACKYPGCGEPAAPAGHPGQPPEYCAGRGHTRVSAWRERRRLAAEKNGTVISPADDASPVTMARMSGAELLRSLRAEADRVAVLGTELRDRIDVLADPTAADAEVEAVRAAAEQRAATAERRAAEAGQFRAEADAATKQMSEELAAVQAVEADWDTAVTKSHADVDAKVAAAQAERDAAIAKIRADADARVRAAETERDAARQAAADAGAAARQAQRETASAQAVADAVQAETGRVRADAEHALTQARTDATREREELRVDLRVRAERAAQQADAYRDELARLWAAIPDPAPVDPPARPVRRGTRGQAVRSRPTEDQ